MRQRACSGSVSMMSFGNLTLDASIAIATEMAMCGLKGGEAARAETPGQQIQKNDTGRSVCAGASDPLSSLSELES